MNNRQKLVQQQFLNDEEKVIKRLNAVYKQSLSDVNDKVKNLSFQIGKLQKEYDWLDPNDPERERVKSMIQSKIYQKQYQEQLHKQLDDIVDKIKTKQFTTVSAYLDECYTNGVVGTMFDLHGQGIPLIMPIDQESMVRAVQLDSKISKGLYTRLGEDVDLLKRKIIGQVSRGIATGMSYAQVAKGLSDYTRIGFNNAVRIARTEGHRIQNQAAMDTMYSAKEKGADIVKQWDATLDGATRESHAAVDGEIRELDKPFSNGLMFAGDPNGGAAEVVNCRCATLQRARAALDEEELKTLQDRAAYFGLDKAEQFDDFKKNYLKALTNNGNSGTISIENCKTVEEVEALMKGKKWFNVQTLNGKVYDTNELLSLKDIDLECAKSIYTTHERLFDKFPQLVGKLNSINTGDLSGLTYAQCSVGFGHGGITVNKKHFKDIKKLLKTYQGDLDYGFHPKGTTGHSIVMHELGHAVDDYLTNTLHAAGYKNAWQAKYVSADLRPKVMRACKMKVNQVSTEVSRYASKDHFEFFAESFAEYMDSENPRQVAKEFGKQLEEILKGVK